MGTTVSVGNASDKTIYVKVQPKLDEGVRGRVGDGSINFKIQKPAKPGKNGKSSGTSSFEISGKNNDDKKESKQTSQPGFVAIGQFQSLKFPMFGHRQYLTIRQLNPDESDEGDDVNTEPTHPICENFLVPWGNDVIVTPENTVRYSKRFSSKEWVDQDNVKYPVIRKASSTTTVAAGSSGSKKQSSVAPLPPVNDE